LTFAEKESDPLRHAKIKRLVDGTVCIGSVRDIQVGTIARERLYLIEYEDRDLEDMTELQVRESLIEGGVKRHTHF
jgi:hypothetical protein